MFKEKIKRIITNIKSSSKRNRQRELQQWQNEQLKKMQPYIRLLEIPKINKEQLTSEMENNDEYYGITKEKRDVRIIVSLTSFPQRMYDIHFCLYSLLNQTVKPDEVILWLGKEQFPDKEKNVPKKVLKLKEHGLSIKFTKDIKSYKKIIPALREYPRDIIITADDDIYYPTDWLEKLYNEYLRDNTNIIGHRAHKIILDKNNKILPYSDWIKCIDDKSTSVFNLLTGVGGVLYPPPYGSLHVDVLNEDLFMKLAPHNDDIWLWAMAVLNNKKIKVVDEPIIKIKYVNPERELGLNAEMTLYSANKLENDTQINNVLKKYPILIEKLKEER